MTNSHHKRTVRETDFGDYLCEQLDEQASALTPSVLQGLRKARAQALAQQTKTASLFSGWKPMASFATAAVLMLSVAYISGFAPGDGPAEADMDTELLFSDEGFQFYEDLEFYRWLANNDL